MRVDKDTWQPADGLILEENAFEVVKSNYNSLVIAGPGAGKTELLAQRASYLLETNECKFPRKILAISFKADAAANLRDRVLLRCGNELSRRFDSMTFDAFSKNLFDRFKSALPDRYKIKSRYIVGVTDDGPLDEYKFRNATYFNTNNRNFLLNYFYETLPQPINSSEEKLRDEIWMHILKGENPVLPFKMIMRLANLIINANPLIKIYLQKTYQYVFLDEFQDTTAIQYDFLKDCFFDGSTAITAVGDDKQRIMVWAGAKETAFSDLKNDVAAKEVPLFMNFRSAPRLVALQNYFVQHLLGKDEKTQPSEKWSEEDGSCDIWVYRDPTHEQQHLLETITQYINVEGIKPRDICILVKQQLNIYAGNLIQFFNSNGVKARDENDLQALLSEELILYVLYFLISSLDRKEAIAYQYVQKTLVDLLGIETDEDMRALDLSSVKAKSDVKAKLSKEHLQVEDFRDMIQYIIDFVGIDKFSSAYSHLKDKSLVEYLIDKLSKILFSEFEISGSIIQSANSVFGLDTVPVMTVHKSKGLEYHTVIFVGLEDNAFWSYLSQSAEDQCTFFVALSRAKQRIVFTFSKIRPDRFGNLRDQKVENIKEIIGNLTASGIAKVTAIE